MLFIASTQTWAQNHVENDSKTLQGVAPRKGEKAMLRGDVNGDGTVTIADVTELVDIILGHTLPELPFDPDDGTGEALAKPN